MKRTNLRIALAVSLSLAALPALALDPSLPVLPTPYPGRTMAAQPDFTPSAISGDPTWPVEASTMPAISYAARTDLTPVYDPPVEAHVKAMESARRAAPVAPAARLAAR
jgi:hypothetical protein